MVPWRNTLCAECSMADPERSLTRCDACEMYGFNGHGKGATAEANVAAMAAKKEAVASKGKKVSFVPAVHDPKKEAPAEDVALDAMLQVLPPIVGPS